MQLPHTENLGTERTMRGLRHTRGGSRLAPLLALFLTAVAARSAAAQDIVRITVQPTTVELATDEVILLTAQATFSDGSVADMSELVEWKSSNTGVVKVSNTNGTKGKVTAKAAGHASISVLDPVSGVTSGQSGGSAAIVVLGRLTSIAVTPQNRRIEVGSTRSMQAIGTFSDGQTRDLTQQVTWTSSDPNVARVSNDPGQRGRVTALAPGTVHIAAASSTGITSTGTGGDATVRVPADLISIQITPSVNRLPIGLTLSLNATGTFSDGSTNDVSNQVTWTSSAPLVASVSNDAGSQGDVTALTSHAGQNDGQGGKYGIDRTAFDTTGLVRLSSFSLRNVPTTLDNLRHQAFQSVNLSLTKNFKLGEQKRLQIRGEALNAFNHPYFIDLSSDPNNASYARYTTQRNLPRDIQLGVKFTF